MQLSRRVSSKTSLWISQARFASRTLDLRSLSPRENWDLIGLTPVSAVVDGQHRRFFGTEDSPNNLTCSLTGSLLLKYVLQMIPYIVVTNLIQIFTGNFIWEGVDVTSKVLDGKRPDIPEGKRTCTLTKEVWRVFTKCWEKAPDCRISVSRVLSLLRYLWVPNSTGGYLLLIRCIKQALSDPLVPHTFSKRSPPQLKGKFSQTRNRLMNWTREVADHSQSDLPD